RPDNHALVQHYGQRATMEQESVVKPDDCRATDHYLDLSSGFVQQRRRFQRALPTANDSEPPACKSAHISPFGRVGCQIRRKIEKFRWAPGKWNNSARYYHAACGNDFPILQPQSETAS